MAHDPNSWAARGQAAPTHGTGSNEHGLIAVFDLLLLTLLPFVLYLYIGDYFDTSNDSEFYMLVGIEVVAVLVGFILLPVLRYVAGIGLLLFVISLFF